MGARRREFSGIAACPGVAVGPALVAAALRRHWPRRHIEPIAVDYQLLRLHEAVEASRKELIAIRDALGPDAPADYRLIVDAHLLMHGDELLLEAANEAVRDECVNAEWAIERAVARIKHHLEQAPHPYFRERAQDVEQVGRSIIGHLIGHDSTLPTTRSECVLVVDDLRPADAARLIESPVLALVTGLGSATSHTAILARTLEIPSVVGVSGIIERVGQGDVLVVDALHNRVILDPAPDEVDRAEARAQRYWRFTRELRSHGTQAISRDGVELSLMVNVDLPEEVVIAMNDGAPGIGLYRTEFLYLDRNAPPDEEEQFAAYKRVVQAAQGRPLVLRTFDLGGDNLIQDSTLTGAPNPALGLRAIRLALSRKTLFRSQLCAILRAAASGDVRLLLPLVSGLADLRRAKQALADARAELDDRGQAYGEVQLGVMVELPAAVIMADRLAPEVDFFSVGTNDLVQYTLAVDRSNPAVAHMADSLDPAVLRLLEHVVRVAAEHGVPVTMCGDMATHPVSLPVVLGLGFRSVSVPLSALPLCREVVRALDFAQATEVARQALECDTANEVHALAREEFGPDLRDLWIEAGID